MKTVGSEKRALRLWPILVPLASTKCRASPSADLESSERSERTFGSVGQGCYSWFYMFYDLMVQSSVVGL